MNRQRVDFTSLLRTTACRVTWRRRHTTAAVYSTWSSPTTIDRRRTSSQRRRHRHVWPQTADPGHSAVQTAADLQDNYLTSWWPERRRPGAPVQLWGFPHPRPFSTPADREVSSGPSVQLVLQWPAGRKFIYADGICLAIQGKYFSELECSLSSDMARMSHFCRQWRLKPSASKTISGVFHLHNTSATRELSVYLDAPPSRFCGSAAPGCKVSQLRITILNETSASVELTQTRHSHSKQLFQGGQISVFLQGGSKSFTRCL